MTKTIKSTEIFRDVPIPATPNPLLTSILRTKRCHGSPGDTNFRMWLHKRLEALGFKPALMAEGTLVAVTDEKSDTLFSCHVDTCHTLAESDGSFQDIVYDSAFGDVLLSTDSKSACLGADDGAGIYVMLRMIEAKVPGTYIFNVGEEKGGIGARAMVAKHKDFFDNFSRAVAFDRAIQRSGVHEVIVTQGGSACASLKAGQALCAALNATKAVFEEDYQVSHNGSFTDTKVFAELVPECFNIGVFYAQQHTPKEWLNAAGLEQLVIACCEIKWDDLPVERKAEPAYKAPPKAAPKPHYYDPMGQGAFGFGAGARTPPAPPARQKPVVYPSLLEEMETYTYTDISDICEDNPEAAAKLIISLYTKLRAAQTEVESLSTILDLT